MTEQSKFLPVATIPIYSDSIGIVTLYDASHANETEEQRIWAVTTIASLAYGNEEAKNPEALYERMQSIKHESLWEFIRYGSNRIGENGIDESMRSFLEYQAYDPDDDNNYEMSTPEEVGFHKQNIACFRIKVPMFVRSQFMRHRSFSYLEMSRRYTKGAKVPFEFWYPQDFHGNKVMLEAQWTGDYKAFSTQYETQVASRFLPQTTYTEFYIMGEVEGLRNFFRLRLDSHAQLEIREVAASMLVLLKVHQPDLYEKVKLQEGVA